MEFSSINPVLLIASLMVAATPILMAALGELVVERAGVLNLGVEGMMITGAICGFIVGVESGSPILGFFGAAIGGAILSLLFGFMTQVLLSNQVATGLGLTLFGLGLSALLGQGYQGVRGPTPAKLEIPILSDIPVLGPILFNHDLMVYFGLLMTLAVWAVLKYSRVGLVLRAVGENHEAAHALGYKVVRIRLLAIMFGGACAGLGGAYVSLVRVPQWTEGMTAGAGWIALAIVVFASWKPGRALLGAYLFGGVTVLQLNLQAAELPLVDVLVVLSLVIGVILLAVAAAMRARNGDKPLKPVLVPAAALFGFALFISILNRLLGINPFSNETLWLSMSPYLATITVLVVMSAGRAPGSLGRTFHASS
jgi:simple sugar transport system permease protein